MEDGVSLLHSNRRKAVPILRQINPNILNKQLRTPEKGWFFGLGFGRGANKSCLYKLMTLRRISRRPRIWIDRLARKLCTARQILFGWWIQDEWHGRGFWLVWETAEVHIGFLWGDLKERDHLEDLGVGRYNVKMDLQESGGRRGLDWSGSG